LTIISFAGGERATAPLPARSRGGNDRLYRRARRHSRWVRFLRACLLLAIPAVLAAVAVQNYLPGIEGLRLPGEIGNMVIKGTKITMQQPRMNGFTSDSRAYEFTADTAAQDITKPDLVELQQIRAKVEMADKSLVHMWADNGLYNMKADMLNLQDNIHLVSSTGYEARLSQALVDMGKGTVVSDEPVWVKLLNGELNSKGLQITEQGEVLRFTDVTMILQSGDQDSPKDTVARQQ
jgi:lipopolysaccharide export system protein LptC